MVDYIYYAELRTYYIRNSSSFFSLKKDPRPQAEKLAKAFSAYAGVPPKSEKLLEAALHLINQKNLEWFNIVDHGDPLVTLEDDQKMVKADQDYHLNQKLSEMWKYCKHWRCADCKEESTKCMGCGSGGLKVTFEHKCKRCKRDLVGTVRVLTGLCNKCFHSRVGSLFIKFAKHVY